MSIVDQTVDSKASITGTYIQAGRYIFEIQKVFGEKKRKGDCFIAELLVVDAVKTDPMRDPNPVGSTCSFVLNFTTQPDTAPANLKAFFLALFGENEKDVTREDLFKGITAAMSTAQPYKYFKIRDEAFDVPTQKNPGKMFTKHKWGHYAPTEAEFGEIEARQNGK